MSDFASHFLLQDLSLAASLLGALGGAALGALIRRRRGPKKGG